MRLYCALCGRGMHQAAVTIGNLPVGPVCAKRAGLLELARKKSGLVFPVVRRQAVQPRPETMELFPEDAP